MKPTNIILIALLLIAGVGIVSAAGNPGCDFTASKVTGPEDLTVTFTGEAYNMSAPFSYHWDFGDGAGAERTSVSSVSPITHTYLNPGKYTISLAVYDIGIPTTFWYKTEKTEYITVTNVPPVANFAIVPEGFTAPAKFHFQSTSTGVIDSYDWNFGDGTTGSGEETNHFFTEGDFTITLTATNDGGSDSASQLIHVNPPKPVADFSSTSTTGVKPFAVQFDGTALYDGSITGWNWSFGDGGHSNGQEPLHVYLTEGNYTVKLTVDSISGSDSTERADYIRVLKSPVICPDPIPVPVIPQDNVAIFRKATGVWYFDTDGDRLYEIAKRFGGSADIPVTGDMNGDKITDYGIFRPSTGYWYFDTNKDGVIDIIELRFGGTGDLPMIGDYNADGKDDVAFFRSSTGYWYIDTNQDGFEDDQFRYGGINDVPFLGNWI